MKAGIRGGHNETSTGAVGVLNELHEDRKIYPYVIDGLKRGGAEAIDLTPSSDLGFPAELYYGINKANEEGIDFGASIHLNCGGGHGCEVWIHDNAKQATVDKANRVLDNLANLGFYNRGIKRCPSEESLAEINKTKCSWMIVEVCFVDSQADADTLNRVGYKAVGEAIAEGILGESLPVEESDVAEASGESYKVRVEVQALNIRKSCNTNCEVVGCIRDNGTYTIVETSGDWGRLKSGAGWICLKYTKRVGGTL